MDHRKACEGKFDAVLRLTAFQRIDAPGSGTGRGGPSALRRTCSGSVVAFDPEASAFGVRRSGGTHARATACAAVAAAAGSRRGRTTRALHRRTRGLLVAADPRR